MNKNQKESSIAAAVAAASHPRSGKSKSCFFPNFEPFWKYIFKYTTAIG